tara:strand:- start:728 stop:1681 length:954 start_codon:yes stop_codon:yes gene_type:complete
MFISRSPLRISFFGGSTDYKDFYSKHGSLLIGTTINKYAFTGLRYRPRFLDRRTYVAYSNYDIVDDVEHINNPLIRETLKYFNIFQHIDLITFNDIPSRTGLGGSSSFCVSLIHSIYKLLNKSVDINTIINQAIDIERNVLKDSGGIQDQIWAGYGGLNSIVIKPDGNFLVKPLPISKEFISEFKQSLTLIYTNIQRDTSEIAKSHENIDKTGLLDIAKEGLKCFSNEDVQGIGKLIKNSWEEKRKISDLISTGEVDTIISNVLDNGAYGAKLLGSGGCGFICVVGPPKVINKINHIYKDRVLNFEFDKEGSQTVLS